MKADPTSRTLLLLVGAGLFSWAVYSIRWALPPFIVAFAFAIVLDPFVDRLQGRRLPRGVAVLLAFLIFLAIFSALVLPLPKILTEGVAFFRNLPAMVERLRLEGDDWLSAHQALLNRLGLPLDMDEAIARYKDQVTSLTTQTAKAALQWAQSSAGKLAWVVLTPIITLYFLVDIDRIRRRLVHLIPTESRPAVLEVTHEIGQLLVHYLRGLVLVCFGQGVTIWLAMGLGFHLPYSLLLGLVGGVLYAVPYLGFLLTLAMALLIGWSSGAGIGQLVGIAVTLAAINQVFDLLITPRVIGGQVGLHPVSSLFALMVGGGLFGLPGMVLAVPVAASARVILARFYPRIFEAVPRDEPSEPDSPTPH